MIDDLLSELPPPSRLAIAYSPARGREGALALLALDARLTRVLAQVSEPMLAQIRFAWWRDNLRLDQAARPRGDPLLDLIGRSVPDVSGLLALIDGFEALLAEDPMPAETISQFAEGRSHAWQAHGRALGCDDPAIGLAASIWALDELSLGQASPEHQTSIESLRSELPDSPPPLPRLLRPLSMLAGLAARARRRGETSMMGSRRSILAAYRLGMFGR